MSKRVVYGPDGREWTVTRSIREGGLVGLLRRTGWVVEAHTSGPPEETRRWNTDRLGNANELVDEVAMALRTGGDGPTQPDG